MRNGGTVSLAVPNLYVRLKVRVATSDTNNSVTDSTQSIAASVQKLPDSIVKSVSRSCNGKCRCVRRNDQLMDRFDVSR
jgi:hypothetical protein